MDFSHQDPKTSTGSAKKYLWIISAFICIIVIATFWEFNNQANHLIKDQLLLQARTFFQEIVLTRRWIADHGGVYVKKQQGMTVNPYLNNIPDVKETITDENNNLYILKNPALITREISELGYDKRIVHFHITSLHPINPDNKADSFEQNALTSFEDGKKENFKLEKTEEGRFFRYMAPLITEQPCLKCHAAQGYKIGDIRGGISVTLPAEHILEEIKRSKHRVISAGLIILILIIIIIFSFSKRLLNELGKAENQLYNMATRDSLTGLLNRREGLKRLKAEISKSARNKRALSLIILDIDHFKEVNDTFGHLAGDYVLQKFSEALLAMMREYDIICRYGGEEFLFVLPETDLQIAIDIADRLRLRVAKMLLQWNDNQIIKITTSSGVSQLQENMSIDELIGKADEALFGAKKRGRNCVYFKE